MNPVRDDWKEKEDGIENFSWRGRIGEAASTAISGGRIVSSASGETKVEELLDREGNSNPFKP